MGASDGRSTPPGCILCPGAAVPPFTLYVRSLGSVANAEIGYWVILPFAVSRGCGSIHTSVVFSCASSPPPSDLVVQVVSWLLRVGNFNDVWRSAVHLSVAERGLMS